VTINLTLKIWRQNGPNAEGVFRTYSSGPISTDISFLEMLDILNENLTREGEEPVAFDHDCREGICGTCGSVINGIPHGPEKNTTLCQLHMRHFKDGDTLVIEPFRARAFKLEKDLVVDRSSFDKIIQEGGYVSVNTGSAPDANNIPIGQDVAEQAMNGAECIGCGACVAACPVGALAFDYKHEIILEAHRRVERLKRPSYIMGLAEAGGTDLITILPAKPKDLGLIAAPKKVINHNLDKIRITASGLLAASVIAGGMYVYAQATKDRDEPRDEPNN